jgi:hypothetical protein
MVPKRTCSLALALITVIGGGVRGSKINPLYLLFSRPKCNFITLLAETHPQRPMLSIPFIHTSKRWLPLLVLLVVLAQLATVAHQHQDEHRLADCGLCLQHTTLKTLHSGHSLPSVLALSPALPTLYAEHRDVVLPVFISTAIRAPPTVLLPPLFT